MALGAAPVIPNRFNFALSDNGRYGVCVRADDDDLTLERWTLTWQDATAQLIPNVTIDRETFAAPLDDGRIVFKKQTSPAGQGQLAFLQPWGSDFRVQRLGEIPALPGCSLLPSLNSAQLGFAITLDDPEHSTIWRLSTSPPQIEPIMRVPGWLSGGVWLDRAEGVLALNQTSDAYRCSGIVVDLLHRSWRRIWSVSDTSTDRIVLSSPRSKVVIVLTNASGEERLGWALLGEKTVHFPQGLHRPGYTRKALALDDRGERVLVHELQQAVSRLFIYTLTDGSLEPVAGPRGTISSPAWWVGNLIRFAYSAPNQPPTLTTVRLGTPPRRSASREHEPQR